VPPLRAALPPLAIGKDYLPTGQLLARAPSGTGWQFSLLGLAGLLVAREEGVEINLFGLSFGWRRRPMRLVLPGLGLVAMQPWRARLNEPFSPIV
jgi:hypothetical protein